MGHPAASIPIPAGLMADHSGTSGALPILQQIPMHNFLGSMVPEQMCIRDRLHTMEDSVDRSSLIGDAILYTLNQEVYLRRYQEDGHLSIDKNSCLLYTSTS